jgi:O-acetylhomoserine/O-acetylserine sulfhydrylase-like pyridoxal-dependent enzyme
MIEDLAATGTTPGMAAWETIGAHIAEREGERRDVMRHMKFDTIAVHGVYDAQAALANQGSINEPLFLSPAQHFAEADEMETALAYRMPSWTYTRIANPTVHYLEETLALLETYGSDVRASACATASGMAAIFMATEPFVALDPSLPPPNIVATAKCYGGTFMLFSERYGRERGSTFAGCEPLDLDEASNIDAGTRFVYSDASNPAVAVFDIPAVAALAHAAGVPSIVDSTVATPALPSLGIGATSWSTR